VWDTQCKQRGDERRDGIASPTVLRGRAVWYPSPWCCCTPCWAACTGIKSPEATSGTASGPTSRRQRSTPEQLSGSRPSVASHRARTNSSSHCALRPAGVRELESPQSRQAAPQHHHCGCQPAKMVRTWKSPESRVRERLAAMLQHLSWAGCCLFGVSSLWCSSEARSGDLAEDKHSEPS